MSVWRETICLEEPLAEARLAGAAAEMAAAEDARLRARYEAGVRDGQKALSDQLLQQRSEVLELQQGVLQSLSQCLPQLRGECETALVELALEVAQKLVAGVPITAKMVETAIREALEQIEETHAVLVLLHPKDLALLQRVNAPVLLATAGGERIRFETSPEVSRGGCLVQTRFGVVDARRETRFKLLKKALQT